MDTKSAEYAARERELSKLHRLQWDQLTERRNAEERELIEQQGREIGELYELVEQHKLQRELAERSEPQEADEPCMCAAEGICEEAWEQIARDNQKRVDEQRARLNYDEAILIVRRFQTSVANGVHFVTDVMWDYCDEYGGTTDRQDIVQYVRVQHHRVRLKPDLTVLGEEYRAAEELHKGWVKYGALMLRGET